MAAKKKTQKPKKKEKSQNEKASEVKKLLKGQIKKLTEEQRKITLKIRLLKELAESQKKIMEDRGKIIDNLREKNRALFVSNAKIQTEHCLEKMNAKDLEMRLTHALSETSIDSLTKLLSKISFRKVGSSLFALSKRKKSPISVLYIGLKDFEEIMTRYGHTAGDDVLKTVAAFLQSQLRESDILGRDGVDKFVALLPETNCGSAFEVTDKIQYAMEALNFASSSVIKDIANVHIRISAYFGVVEALKEDDFINLLMEAEERMYLHKLSVEKD